MILSWQADGAVMSPNLIVRIVKNRETVHSFLCVAVSLFYVYEYLVLIF